MVLDGIKSLISFAPDQPNIDKPSFISFSCEFILPARYFNQKLHITNPKSTCFCIPTKITVLSSKI